MLIVKLFFPRRSHFRILWSFIWKLDMILEYSSTSTIEFYGRSNLIRYHRLSYRIWRSCARWCNVSRDLMGEHRAGVQSTTRVPCHRVLSYILLQHPSRMDLCTLDNAGECAIIEFTYTNWISCSLQKFRFL